MLVVRTWQELFRKTVGEDRSRDMERKLMNIVSNSPEWDVAIISAKGTDNFQLLFRDTALYYQRAVANAVRMTSAGTADAKDRLLWRDAHRLPVASLNRVARQAPLVLSDFAWLLAYLDNSILGRMFAVEQMRCSLRAYISPYPAAYLPERKLFLAHLKSFFDNDGSYLGAVDISAKLQEWIASSESGNDTKSTRPDAGSIRNYEDFKVYCANLSTPELRVQVEGHFFAWLNDNTDKKLPTLKKSKADVTPKSTWDPATCTTPQFNEHQLVQELTRALDAAQKKQEASLIKWPADPTGKESTMDVYYLPRLLERLQATSARIRAEHTRSLDEEVQRVFTEKLQLPVWFATTLLPQVHRAHLVRVFALEGDLKQAELANAVERSEVLAHLHIIHALAEYFDLTALKPLRNHFFDVEAKAGQDVRKMLADVSTWYNSTIHPSVAPSFTAQEKSDNNNDFFKMLHQIDSYERDDDSNVMSSNNSSRARSVYGPSTTHQLLYQHLRMLVFEPYNEGLFTDKDDKQTYRYPASQRLADWSEKNESDENTKGIAVTKFGTSSDRLKVESYPILQQPVAEGTLPISEEVLQYASQRLISTFKLPGDYNTPDWIKNKTGSWTQPDRWNKLRAHVRKVAEWLRSFITSLQLRQLVDIIVLDDDCLLTAQHKKQVHRDGNHLRGIILPSTPENKQEEEDLADEMADVAP